VRRAAEYDELAFDAERGVQAVLTKAKAVDWVRRQENLKELEWSIAEKMLAKAKSLLEDPSVKWTGGDIAKALDIASKLGRLATGMETDRKEVTGKDGGPVRVEVDVAPLIKRVYGAAPAGAIESGREAPVIDVVGEAAQPSASGVEQEFGEERRTEKKPE
jgi:hypothetical protein